MLTHRCAYCGNQTHFTARACRVVARIKDTKYRHRIEVAATCDACSRFNVAIGLSPDHNQWHDIDSDVDVYLKKWAENMTDVSWSPPSMVQADSEYLPEEIVGFYQEAHDAMSISAFRAVLLLSRSVIEATAKINNIGGANLVKMIDNMHEEGLVRRGVKEVAHAIRQLGNDIAHGDLTDPPTQEDAEDVLKLTRMILDDVYVADAVRADILKRRGKEA